MPKTTCAPTQPAPAPLRLPTTTFARLRALVHRHAAHDGELLRPGDLLNRVYGELHTSREASVPERTRFMALSGGLLRRILVRQAAATRHTSCRVALSSVPHPEQEPALPLAQIPALDQALDRLTVADAPAARVVELHVFGGLSLAEIANLLPAQGRDPRLARHDSASWLAETVAALTRTA